MFRIRDYVATLVKGGTFQKMEEFASNRMPFRRRGGVPPSNSGISGVLSASSGGEGSSVLGTDFPDTSAIDQGTEASRDA